MGAAGRPAEQRLPKEESSVRTGEAFGECACLFWRFSFNAHRIAAPIRRLFEAGTADTLLQVRQPQRMRHIKLLGWLWLLLGGLWSLLALLSLINRAQTDLGYTMSGLASWQEVIGDTLEGAIFVVSAVAGLALLRGWRWSRPAIWILGPI